MSKQRDLVRMTPEEADAFLHGSHTMSCATLGPNGVVHLSAMWYGFVDGKPAIATKRKSQKARNLERAPTITCLIHDGETYNTLRGLQLVCSVDVISDLETLITIGRSIRSRYDPDAPADERPLETTMQNRVGFVMNVLSQASWDHSKIVSPPRTPQHATAPVGTEKR